MRKGVYVPMIALCLLLAGCGSAEETTTVDLRKAYQEMSGCTMEATVSCEQDGSLWEADLRCEYVPGGESVVEVLAPETIAGVKVVLNDTDWQLECGDAVLNAGTLSGQAISPAECLPRLMCALRDGWLLEENEELWNEIPCLRIAMDQSTQQGGKILTAVWLRQEDSTPLRGEIAVDGEIILTAEFTSFTFYDKISQ